MKIAICDDDQSVHDDLITMLDKLSTENEISLFNDAETLLAAFNQGQRFDLLFTDIVMGELTGMAAAKQIRVKDKQVFIVFTSSYNEFMEEAFDVDATAFIPKPLLEAKVEKVYQRCVAKYLENHSRITLKIQNGDGSVSLEAMLLSDIMYARSDDKTTLFYKSDGTCSTAIGTMQSYEPSLPKLQFISPYRGIWVNLNAIETIMMDKVVLKANGQEVVDTIPLSRKNKAMVERAFSDRLFGQGDD